ncbi:MAG: hypothetical protein AB7T32_05515, partial [Dehalococcoidia bacterium]
MLRLTEVKLPLDHSPADLEAAVLERLQLTKDDLTEYVVFKRSVDARKRNAILFTYILDVTVKDEAATLERLKRDSRVSVAPDTSFQIVAHAPQNLMSRPVVVGMGPAGMFAGLILAQSGFRPLILERGKVVRERTKDTFGFWRGG